MPEKRGNGGWGFEDYDPQTGKYIADGAPNKRYENVQEIAPNKLTEEQILNLDLLADDDEEDYLGAPRENSQILQNTTTSEDEITQKFGFQKKQGPHVIEEDIKQVNPNFDPNSKSTSFNCSNCGMTYEMVCRGYDVTAQELNNLRRIAVLYNFDKSSPEYNSLLNSFTNAYVKGQFSGKLRDYCIKQQVYECGLFLDENNQPTHWISPGQHFKNGLETKQEIEKQFLSSGEGARFIIYVQWKASMGDAHIFNAEVRNGKVIYIDGQTNQASDANSNDSNNKQLPTNYFNYIKRNKLLYIRTDNKKINTKPYLLNKDIKDQAGNIVMKRGSYDLLPMVCKIRGK